MRLSARASWSMACSDTKENARSSGDRSQAPRFYRFNGFVLDVLERSLIDPDGAATALSGMDFQLLKLLVEHPGEVLDRSRLAEVTRTVTATAPGAGSVNSTGMQL